MTVDNLTATTSLFPSIPPLRGRRLDAEDSLDANRRESSKNDENCKSGGKGGAPDQHGKKQS